MKRWYVVNTRPHQEGRADLNLRRQGFEAWLPRLKRTRRHARRWQTVLAPLFPGYLFVRLDPDAQAWHAIHGPFGVRWLICHDGRPAPVAGGFVDVLHESVDGEGAVSPAPDGLRPGDRVRVLSGPFADRIGTLVRLAERERVALMLEALVREVQMTVYRSQVAAVG